MEMLKKCSYYSNKLMNWKQEPPNWYWNFLLLYEKNKTCHRWGLARDALFMIVSFKIQLRGAPLHAGRILIFPPGHFYGLCALSTVLCQS